MEDNTDIPVWKKRTPTNYPDLKQEWEKLYHELHVEQGIKKSAALEMIGNRFGVSRPTVMTYLNDFDGYKKYKKNLSSNSWEAVKKNPITYNRRVDHAKRYMHLRMHLDQYVAQAFACTPLYGSMTLEDLSRGIELQTGVSLAPKTILGLSERYKVGNKRPLITENGQNPVKYSLNLDF